MEIVEIGVMRVREMFKLKVLMTALIILGAAVGPGSISHAQSSQCGIRNSDISADDRVVLDQLLKYIDSRIKVAEGTAYAKDLTEKALEAMVEEAVKARVISLALPIALPLAAAGGYVVGWAGLYAGILAKAAVPAVWGATAFLVSTAAGYTAINVPLVLISEAAVSKEVPIEKRLQESAALGTILRLSAKEISERVRAKFSEGFIGARNRVAIWEADQLNQIESSTYGFQWGSYDFTVDLTFGGETQSRNQIIYSSAKFQAENARAEAAMARAVKAEIKRICGS